MYNKLLKIYNNLLLNGYFNVNEPIMNIYNPRKHTNSFLLKKILLIEEKSFRVSIEIPLEILLNSEIS